MSQQAEMWIQTGQKHKGKMGVSLPLRMKKMLWPGLWKITPVRKLGEGPYGQMKVILIVTQLTPTTEIAHAKRAIRYLHQLEEQMRVRAHRTACNYANVYGHE